jgi:hypothetical protein
MAVWMNELRRKAQAGTALADATPEKQKIYDEYRKKITDESKRKAQAGVALTNPNEANQKIWDDKRKQIDTEIQRKALKGDALTNPNAYNQAMYDKFVADNKTNTTNNTNTDDNQVGDVGKSDDSQTNTGTTTQTPQNFIEGLTKAKRDAQIASLSQSRDQALSNLQGEKEGIAPKYYDARNQLAARSQQDARNFAEYMAARGGTTSGANAQATLMNNMSLQGNLGDLGRQETQAFGDIARRESDVRNQYLNNLNQAEAGILGDRMNLLLNDYYRAQDRGDRLTQQAIQNEFARAGLTGFLGDQRTLAGQQFDYGQSRDTVLDNRYDARFDYDKSRDTILDNRYDDEFQYKKDQDKIANDNWNKEFMAEITGTYVDADGVVRQTTAEQQRKLSEFWKLADQTGVIGAQLGEIYGLPADTPTMAGKQFALDKKRTESSIANDDKQTSASVANANASKTQSEINTLLNIWEMYGKAPPGLEKYGIPVGTPYNKQTSSSVSSSSGSSSTAKVNAKDSADNYFAIIDGFEVEGATRDQALKFIEEIRDYLTDSDYRKMREWINENLK